uniref:Serine/threonine-protein phosphatase 6 regulatory ankyrin repeat subunit B n=1 Tax=Ceratitis capitata TaxID=7213 RepID=W8BBU3_CERCA
MPPKRRRRFQGLYYHSSPPKVLPMNGQASNQGRRKRDIDEFSVKLSTIRIWMHEKDIGKLTRILWAGQGSRLCQQASTNSRVKRFLAAVPYVMNSIKDVHQAVIDNNLETLQAKMEPPVPPALITCRDANGLNLIHKAAGLGHTKILEYLIGIWPDGAAETDITGKTPLHWAASHKNNMRCYTLLTQAGCDEEAMDYKMKSPTYYRHKPHEIERAFLVYVPEAPRVSPDVATDWEALCEDTSDGGKKLDIKIPDTNGFHGRSTDDSIENTSEVDLNDGISATEEEQPAPPKTAGNGDESAPATPAKDNDEAAVVEVAPEETPKENGEMATSEENGHEEPEAEAEAELEAAETTDEAAAEPEAVENADAEVEATAEKHNRENETAAASESENESRNGYESDNEPEPEAQSDAEPDDEVLVVTDHRSAEKLDENHNEDKYDNGDAASSPTSSLAIEGFVAGASEDNRVQSQSAAYVHEVLTLSIQSDVREAIESGDMEQLAQIVLNGDGNKLVNMESHNPDIQAFLNNVPNYMSKIRRVHEASREGSLLALQQALDRRKFAVAKDEISPNGATPLHVAVVFGNTDIVRYLAARFPETTTITDSDGRTALHYAATINDNGHFYNVLTQLGANSKALDKLGHTPEFYQNKEEAKDILNYKQLLSNFGAEELEGELLNDQGQAENTSSQMNPIFKTEQGKYLANNLADPLIKALTEIANKRPEDPVAFLANYLQNYLHQRDPTEASNSGKTNSTATLMSNSGMLRRTDNGLRSSSNTNGDEERIEEDHISDLDVEEETNANLDDRDEHGQSMLHFACARSHRRGALMHLIEESNIDITYRDELYRTARDVSLQANQPSNAKDIDRYVLSLAVIGDVKPFEKLAVEGYDHIVDITDDNDMSIVNIALERGHEELASFLRNLRGLEELREELHQMIRDGNVGRVREIVAEPNGKWLLKAKNYYGRTALHIAILKENEEVVDHFVHVYPEVLKIGDNLERTALHYAMGTNAIESLSRILILKGAKRTTKDLKGRQPSYYFMNKADILRLQEEEEENR